MDWFLSMADVLNTAGIVVACLIVFLPLLWIMYATCIQACKSTDQSAEPQDLTPSETEMTAK